MIVYGPGFSLGLFCVALALVLSSGWLFAVGLAILVGTAAVGPRT